MQQPRIWIAVDTKREHGRPGRSVCRSNDEAQRIGPNRSERVRPVAHPVVEDRDELLPHTLDLCVKALASGPQTAQQAAGNLPWTRHEHAYDDLDVFNRGMAAMETKAHLELLVARGRVSRTEATDGIVFTLA